MIVQAVLRARNARYARWDAGGEGSRGGKVIGHTGSGKPVYERHGHPEHASFTADDHRHAARLHREKAEAIVQSGVFTGTSHKAIQGRARQQQQAMHHMQQAKLHKASAGPDTKE